MEKPKRFGEYWRRAYGCPFYKTNEEDIVLCEAGTLHFSTRDGINKLLDYCEVQYSSCPIYKAKMIDYETKERERYEQRCREISSRNKGLEEARR